MKREEVLAYQKQLVKNYKYRPLPTLFSDEARDVYRESIPEGFSLDGKDAPLFASSGLKLCSRYNRIVVGDYGAYVEIMPEDILHENIVVKKGQEYRETDARYSGNVKYSWLTMRDNSDVKIYFQKKSVAYADYIPGRYYVSVYECIPSRAMEKISSECASREEIANWLKAHGVFSEDLADYYSNKAVSYPNTFDCAIKHNVSPFDVELWMRIVDVCQAPNGLHYEQYQAIAYNLSVINYQAGELNGALESLPADVRTAVEMGLECFEFPYELQNLSPELIREVLKLPADDLLCVSKFSKVIVGHKAKEQIHDVEGLLKTAAERVPIHSARQVEQDLVR